MYFVLKKMLPLRHIYEPHASGGQRIIKNGFDRK